MKNLLISLVIPCYNKADRLKEVLGALVSQVFSAGEFEAIIVDDGSTDSTEMIVRSMSLPSHFRYVRQRNQGAAAARNHGVREAKGELVLFLDGDVIADSFLIEHHVLAHREDSGLLVMGRLKDLPSQTKSVFYETVHSTAVFDHGEEEKELPFIDGFTGNLSLKREAFWEIGEFDETFPRSGFEDTEFIYRATQVGYKLMYNPRAIGYHDGFLTFEEACRHLRSYQASAVLLMKKHPEIVGQIPHLRDKEPISWKEDNLNLILRKIARQLLALPVSIFSIKMVIGALEKLYPRPSVLRPLYWKVLSSYLLLGVRDGISRYGSPFGSEKSV
jgi:glycosyltransferase involved in cell wall biosynthesis